MVRRFRGFLASCFGVLLTGIFVLLGCLLALPLKLVTYLFGLRKNPIHRLIGWWAYLMRSIFFKRLLGIDVVLTAQYRPRPPTDDEVVVCICNHPPTLLTPALIYYITRYICRDVVAIAKRELLWNPIGWFAWLVDAGIFIDRSSRLNSYGDVMRGVDRRVRTPLVIIIFPDMHRPSKKLIEKDQEKFVSRVPDIKRWLHHTLIPRAGALCDLLGELEHTQRKFRIVDVTIASSADDDSIFKIANLIGSKVSIKADEVSVSSFPYKSFDSLCMRLNVDWRRKNKLIESWKDR